jgi:signal transduction histidine kinase
MLPVALKPSRAEWALVILIPLAVFILASQAELSERFALAAQAHEGAQLDELPAALLALSATLAWLSWRSARRARQELALRLSAESALMAKQRELKRLSRQATDALEAERHNIAHELHDDLGQTLNAIKIEAVALRKRTDDPDGPEHRGAQAIVDLADRSYEAVRRMLGRLRPVALDELGLPGALEHAASEWQSRSPAIQFSLQGARTLPALDDRTAIALYRICQESVTNVLRHAAPTRVTLRFEHRAGENALHLEIADNGRGADIDRLRPGLGLIGMRERIENLGGSIAFLSTPGSGFSVKASVPLDTAVPAAA